MCAAITAAVPGKSCSAPAPRLRTLPTQLPGTTVRLHGAGDCRLLTPQEWGTMLCDTKGAQRDAQKAHACGLQPKARLTSFSDRMDCISI